MIIYKCGNMRPLKHGQIYKNGPGRTDLVDHMIAAVHVFMGRQARKRFGPDAGYMCKIIETCGKTSYPVRVTATVSVTFIPSDSGLRTPTQNFTIVREVTE